MKRPLTGSYGQGLWLAVLYADISSGFYFGGDEGIRTLDLGVANAALSQLSYIPVCKWFYTIWGRPSIIQRPVVHPFSDLIPAG